MAYWIFKVAEQELYPDVPGEQYVYDNTHSVRVVKDDAFLYLDKMTHYSFTATGLVRKVTKRVPSRKEAARTGKVRTVFTAHLTDVIWFTEPLSISPLTKEGKKHRARLGIVDANLLGWSQSIPSLNEEMYQAILDLAEMNKIIQPMGRGGDFAIPDNWGKTKIRCAIIRFSDPVMKRSNAHCIVCGSLLQGLVEAAHLSPYGSDRENRANPANGICLCKYCHRALDLRLIAIQPDGVLLIAPHMDDQVARYHFSRIEPERRRQWLTGVDPKFLRLTVQWYRESLSSKQV